MAQNNMIKAIKRLLQKNSSIILCDIYTAKKGGDKMISHTQIEALENIGLLNDRYATKQGYWHHVESCQVTLISTEDIKRIERKSNLSLQNGIHRRNLLISGISSKALEGQTFQLGTAIFKYDKPRPPCGYIDSVSSKGMAKALGRQSGICLHIVRSGLIKKGDVLNIL